MTAPPPLRAPHRHPRGQTLVRARGLRRQMSLPEVLLWQALRRHRHGLKFRRQHPIGPFIVDFFCAELRTAIEVDGSCHDYGDAGAYDARRDRWLAGLGVKVVRIPARLVLSDVDAAVEVILDACRKAGAGHCTDPLQGDAEAGLA